MDIKVTLRRPLRLNEYFMKCHRWIIDEGRRRTHQF